MVRPDYASIKVAELAALPRFPIDQDARLMIYRTVIEMVQFAGRKAEDSFQETVKKDEAALDWLISRAVNLWNKWEGIRELRAIYCSRYHPGDGIESTSAIYTDGVPPDPTVPRLALPAPPLQEWPQEELEAMRRAWAARNKLSPAEKRRQEMQTWLDKENHDVTVLDAKYDDALIGVAVLASNRAERRAVYDWEALVETVEDREGLTPALAVEAIGNIWGDILLFYRPPGASLRPTICTVPVTQEEIDRALTVARAKREGWTPERLAEVEAEVQRREAKSNEHD